MKIETKYNISDEVWFRIGHLVVKGLITDIFLFKQEGKIVIGYCINDYDHALIESDLFPTKEELSKVPFRMVSHMAMEGEHYSLYANDDYGFRMQKTTKIKKDGFTTGKTYTDYFYDGKWYSSLDKFIEAIKYVRPIKPVEETESGCKIIDIRLKKK